MKEKFKSDESNICCSANLYKLEYSDNGDVDFACFIFSGSTDIGISDVKASKLKIPEAPSNTNLIHMLFVCIVAGILAKLYGLDEQAVQNTLIYEVDGLEYDEEQILKYCAQDLAEKTLRVDIVDTSMNCLRSSLQDDDLVGSLNDALSMTNSVLQLRDLGIEVSFSDR